MGRTIDTLRWLDDLPLDVYQARLMQHYWRVGMCWEIIETTAEKCKISVGKVHQARNWLLQNGYIGWTMNDNGKKSIRIILPEEKSSPHENDSHSEEVSPHESFSPHENKSSPHENGVNALQDRKFSPHEAKISIEIEVGELAKHFTQAASILPSRSNYEAEWNEPLQMLLKQGDGVEGAKRLITDAVKFARDGPKRYTIASPRSVTTIIANMQNGQSSTAVKVKTR